MPNRNRKRVPEVLWRLFRWDARTLADTIAAVVPPCHSCNGDCLSCGGDAFLLRPEDPLEYRRLLRGCYAVVSENAPALSVHDPESRWPMLEIVQRSIEIILREQPSSENLICSNYDRVKKTSAVVDVFTSSEWAFLLTRVGDAVMLYLLKYTSIFLPLPQKKYHQVAGFPVSNLCAKLLHSVPDSEAPRNALAYHGSKKRRKLVLDSESKSEKRPNSYGVESSSNVTRTVGSEASSCVCDEDSPFQRCKESSKHDVHVSRKRTRPFRWQRQRNRRQLAVQGIKSEPFVSSSQRDDSKIQHCACCSVFHNALQMNKNTEINRRNLFYRLGKSSSVFPRKHILYTIKPNDSGATDLFNSIFGSIGIGKNTRAVPCPHSQASSFIRSNCLYHSLMKLLKRIIRETHNLPYLRLLDKHCPVTSSFKDANNSLGSVIEHPQATAGRIEPSKKCCEKKQVVSFIWAICRRMVPSEMLGDTSNWRILRKNISKFIQLRKYEKFTLKECIYKLKLSKFPFMSDKLLGNDACRKYSGCGLTDSTRHLVVESWIFWFFSQLISPLIQANFYVTESENDKHVLSYYRKSTWHQLINEAGSCMNGKRYRLLNHVSARKILSNRRFGFSRARIRPKQFGFRVLINLRAPSRMPMHPLGSRIHSTHKSQRKVYCSHQYKKYQSFKSVNSVLRDFHVVLKGLSAKEKDKLGSSVFDYNDVYRKLVPFLFLLKEQSLGTMPGVFIVVADVLKAFDSIDQDKLLGVMKDVIVDDEYSLEMLLQVISAKKSLKLQKHLTLASQDMASASSKFTPQLPGRSLDGILVSKELSRIVTKEEFLIILKEHITRNVVQLNGNFYLQRVGIPQGSVLSSLLCSFYYGHMERNVIFPFLEKACEGFLNEYEDSCGVSAAQAESLSRETYASSSKCILLRFIDDFLFISTSKKQASMFFSRLKRGVREYNCCMNEDKYGLNFGIEDKQGCESNRLYIGKDGVSFLRWSGLLVNCCTLEIQADYTRYLNSHLSSTLTVSSRGKVGHMLKMKLRNYLRPKCHPIFYDSNISSPGVVRLNIYQAFLLCAMKFLCHVSKLSILPRFSPTFYIDAIYSSLRYMHRLIKKKMYSLAGDVDFRPKYEVKRKDVLWLGLYAHTRVIKKKQSQNKELLRLLVSKLKAYGKLENMSPELRYAVDDAHSSVLWSIKY